MYITEFELTNIRCFRGEHSVSLDRGDGEYAGWTVIAGRNGTGKTTLLRALVMAMLGYTNASRLTISPQWVSMGSLSGTCSARFTVEADDARIPGVGPGLATESGVKIGSTRAGEAALISGYTGSSLGLPPEVYKHLHGGLGPWSDSPHGYFLAAYGSQRRLGAPLNNFSPILSYPRLSRVVTLFYESATLQDAVQWLKDVHTRALEKREGAEQLKSDVLRLLNDGLLPDGSHVDRVDSDGLWVTRDGVTLPLQEISDGYRAVTSLVLDLVGHLSKTFPKLGFSEVDGAWACPQPGVVLIDEVDAHLHVEWQRRIGFWLTQHFPRIQFLVTTHSPFICQAASPKGLIRLPAPGEERKIEHVSENIWREVVNGGVDDAVMSELFGLDSAMSDRAVDLRDELAELEAKILDGVATEADRALYRRNKARLPNDPGTLAEHQLRTLHKRADKR